MKPNNVGRCNACDICQRANFLDQSRRDCEKTVRNPPQFFGKLKASKRR